MPDTNLDGVIALSDADIRVEQARAEIAEKYAQAELTIQKAVNQHLMNLSLFQNIQWDAEAHDNLMKQTHRALRAVKQLQTKHEMLLRKIKALHGLINGAEVSWEGIRQGWLGLYVIRSAIPIPILTKAYRSTPEPDGLYDEHNWSHPWSDTGAVVLPFIGHKDPSTLFAWAAKHSYYPVFSEPPWVYVTSFLETIDAGAQGAVMVIEKDIADAKAVAMDLEQRDWKRLEHPAGGGGASPQQTMQLPPYLPQFMPKQ